MRRWYLVILGITLTGVLLQAALYLRDGPPAWLFRSHTDLLVKASHTLTTRSEGLRQGLAVKNDDGGVRHAHSHHPYPFLLNEPRACSNLTELVMVVITAINNSDDRQAVRETWGSYRDDLRHNVSMVFLVGAASSREQQAKLMKESRQHHDIVQEDFVDSYRNLSLKSVALLKWVTLFCNSSKYVLKVDDDMYINLSNLISALRKESLSHSTFVLGHVFMGARPVQNKQSKWYTPTEAFKEAVYPRYTSGTAYAMTTSAAMELYAASAHVPVFWLEDIYITGLCSRKAGVPVFNHGGFSYTKAGVDGCHFRKVISGHKYTAEEKRAIFQQVNDPNLKCR